ncbi:MAG: alpha/beta hydrolase [Vicinamibacterales bacterium]
MTEFSEASSKPLPADAVAGEFVTETFDYDGGRQVTVYVPPHQPEAIVFAADGQMISPWGRLLEASGVPSTMIVGAHRVADETLRLHEYSPGFDPERFAAHERFFVDVGDWVRSRFGVTLSSERTAVCGASAGGELALAIGLRHPGLYGAIFSASPGGGYRPPAIMPSPLPRTYLVAGTLEPFFRKNATRWAAALRDAAGNVVMTERIAGHDDAMWREEFPLMVAWAFGGVG